jgi:hypothetical protein
MEDHVKNVCMVNGSLRGEKASSLGFLKDVRARMDPAVFEARMIAVRAVVKGGYPRETLTIMSRADAIVIAFPLFVYTLPGGLTRLLEEYQLHAGNGGNQGRKARVYAIVNCGFPEPEINREAIRVIRNFCARLGLRYRFTVAVGSGPVTAMTRKVPFLNLKLKRAFAEMVRDMGDSGTDEREDVFVSPVIPKGIILRIKDHYEKKSLTLA